VDEKWINNFYAFLDTLHVKKSLLPAEDDEKGSQQNGERKKPAPSGGGRK
jgi:hypothetical protein